MAILPNSRPSTGWRRGYLTNNCIKEIFDVGKTQVFQNCNDKIVTTTPRSSTPRDTATTPKCQEAPRTMFSSQNHRNDSKIPPLSLKIIMKFEERRVKTLRQEASPERRRDWGVKRILLSDIYNPKTQNIFVLDSTTPGMRSSRGLLSRGWLWLPTCNAHDAAISPTCRGTT